MRPSAAGWVGSCSPSESVHPDVNSWELAKYGGALRYPPRWVEVMRADVGRCGPLRSLLLASSVGAG
jgi:hypothetical protein